METTNYLQTIIGRPEAAEFVRILIALVLGLILIGKLEKRKSKLIYRLLVHSVILFLATTLLTFDFKLSLMLTGLYSSVFGLFALLKNWEFATSRLGLEVESLHDIISIVEKVILVVFVCAFFIAHVKSWEFLIEYARNLVVEFKVVLIILAYLLMLWPSGNLVKFYLKGIASNTTDSNSNTSQDAERGGRIIGMFERLIILTLVLLGEYAAIGFLITGKSIIRFATNNENIRSEYVLAGTMVSYAIAICVGVITNLLLH